MPRASKPFLQRAAAPLPFKDAAKGYLQADFKDAFRRYMPKAEIEEFLAQSRRPEAENPPIPPSPDSPKPSSNGSADES